MQQMANNPKGNPATLRAGNPKEGVALPAQRIRMPDVEAAAMLEARLEAVGRTGRAAELGRLLALALRMLQE
jgi:hypothetical protein